MQDVINNAYVKQLAEKHKVSVSEQELREQIDLLRSQNRLGSSDAVFEDVLKEFWGWTVDDFKRELKQQLLAQKVVSALDTETHTRAQNVLTQLQNGGDFAALAKQFSDDTQTKGIVETPLGLEILKVREVEGSRVRASHIFFAFKPINTYLDPLKEDQNPQMFISP
jgi:parvulin-like peptidyl-prolyl isomerase